MKILFVSPYPPSRDGIGDYTKLLVDAIKNAGHEVRVVIPHAAPQVPSEVIGNLPSSGRLDAELKHEIASWSPDIMHVQFAIAAFSTRTIAVIHWLTLVRRELGIPVVVTLHELTRERASLGPVGHGIHRLIVKRCDQLILHSDKVREELETVMVTKTPSVAVIPHPTAPRRTSTSSEDELRDRFGLGTSRILLAFGFIHIDKGLEDLISALHIIQVRTPESLDRLRLVIAGDIRPRHGLFRVFEFRDWIYRMRLVRQIRHSNLQSSIVLTGYVPHDEVAAWFELAEAAILPYRRAEHSGVESLARSFDLPVLTSTVGGLGEHMSDSPWTFPPRAPNRIAETIAKFFATETSARDGYKGGNEFEDPTDLLIVTTKTLNLYTEVQDKAGKKHHRVAHT